MCLKPSAAIEITLRDVRGFRIEDRRLGDQTWYLVSVSLSGGIQDRIRKLLSAPRRATDEALPNPNAPDFFPDFFGGDMPYAVLIDREASVVLPACAIRQSDSPVAATQELSRAEAIAYAWGIPVTRVIQAEIAAQRIQVASLVELIANPSDWIGKRISVRGYLAAGDLYLSREHAEAFDDASSVFVQLPPNRGGIVVCADNEVVAERISDLFSECLDQWVVIEAFVDADGGVPKLTRIERLASFPNGHECWPPSPPDAE